MLGANHAILSFAIIYGHTGSFFAAGIGAMGGVFPDAIERILFGKKRLQHHRRTSHWFVPYLAAVLLLSRFLADNPISEIFIDIDHILYIPISCRSLTVAAAFFLRWFFVGALLHIAEDAFCGPIPIFFPWYRRKLFMQIIKTGRRPEYILSRGVLLVVVLCRYLQSSIGATY